MTPRERIITTLQHQKPDQVPIQLWCRDEVWAALREYYQVGTDQEVAAVLGADMTRDAIVRTRWPDFDDRADNEVYGERVIMRDDGCFEDRWGVIERFGRDGKYVEWVSGPFAEIRDLDAFDWPGDSVLVDDAGLARRVAEFQQAGFWVIGGPVVNPFKQSWRMRGMADFLCDYVADPAFVEAIYERMLEFNLPICRRLAAAGVDMISFYTDVAMQDRMLVPPDRWRQLDKPLWRRIIGQTRQIKPDVRFFFHSDGDIRPIIGDIIELGFDVLNPIQPECFNPAEIKARWGGRITLDGGGSVQRTLPFGTVDDVRAEVDFLMKTCAYDGGYILRPSNFTQFDSPVQNVAAFFETARDYDMASLTGPPASIPQPPCMRIGR